LGDPSLEVLYWHSSSGTWVDELGQAVALPTPDDARAVSTLERDGDWVAALLHEPELLDQRERVRAACAAVTDQIDDERLAAALRAQVREERASRSRIVAASDRQRRRFERNLHDGAQQRLVGLALMLRLAGKGAADDDAVTALLTEAATELDDAIRDLRELARGLHPAIVSDAGLAAGVRSLAELPGIPVELTLDVPDRLPEEVEVAAYYLVAECLANANKHSGAQRVAVDIRVVDGALEVSVADDGRGGASISGSGLTGLADRLGALAGVLAVESDGDHGSTVIGTIPIQAPTATSLHHVDDLLLRVVPDHGPGLHEQRTERQRRWLRGDLDRRRRALKWISWQSFAVPGEIVEAQPESEDLLHAKAMLLFVGGNRQISDQRRDWIIGYLTAAGYSEQVLDAARAYDDADRVEDIVAIPRIAIARLVLLYDALRTCAFDSDTLSPDAFDPVLRAADAIGISRDVVADLHAIVLEELRLRQRRHDIVVAPALPKLLNDSLAAIGDAAADSA
jgi:signal transduction histidine kinase